MKKIFKKHYDLILGFLIFVSYRYVFNFLLFYKRDVPPEPDDSYFYLANAANALKPDTFESFRLLPFSLWVKFISFFTKLNLESAYELNFYIGPIVMFVALAYFLRRLEANKRIRLFLIFIITLYSGTGSYHGFYWVVPSFYQLALFFVVLSFVISQKIDKFWKIFTASFTFIFIHPTSIFVSMIFLAYPFVYFFIKQKFQLATFFNTAKVIFALAVSYGLYVLIGLNFPHAGSPESFETILKLLTDFISGNLKADSFPVIWSEYFSIFFLNPLTTTIYFLMLFFLYKAKRFEVLSGYICALILVLFSSFLPYGWRALGFLWPLTFLMIGYAIVGFAASFEKF